MAAAAVGRSQPVYKYVYTHVSDSPLLAPYGAFHGSELPMVFDTLDKSAREEQLSAKVENLWTSFAQTGLPGATWPAFKDGEYLQLNLPPFAKSGFREQHCDFWDTFSFPKPRR